MMGKIERIEVLRMVADVVAAYVGNNTVPAKDVPSIIEAVFGSLTGIERAAWKPADEPPKPAVSVDRSVTQDYLVCLEDGKRLKVLKRHLRANYDMTPEEYRAKWGLPPDYPMVAPSYAAQRSELAKKIGLGRRQSNGRPVSEAD